MTIDDNLKFSDAQALSGAGSVASTTVVDFSSDRNIGVGEPVCVVVKCDVALAGTSPTVAVAVQVDDNSAFTSPTVLITGMTLTSLAAGAQLAVPIPPSAAAERYMRVLYTLGGTAPTVTVTAFLAALSSVGSWAAYPSGYTVGS